MEGRVYECLTLHLHVHVHPPNIVSPRFVKFNIKKIKRNFFGGVYGKPKMAFGLLVIFKMHFPKREVTFYAKSLSANHRPWRQ